MNNEQRLRILELWKEFGPAERQVRDSLKPVKQTIGNRRKRVNAFRIMISVLNEVSAILQIERMEIGFIHPWTPEKTQERLNNVLAGVLDSTMKRAKATSGA